MAALAFIINWIWQTFFFNIVSFATKWQNVFFLKGKTLSQSLLGSERERMILVYTSVLVILCLGFQLQMPSAVRDLWE